ncbi:hypothetical protein AAF712_015012 [Marasmius tenuissimus]|uniref:Uncharacterized protein n=1 Tax=Marasmius tenuissimus TaxID=585030 RepID=A0ABR2ZCW8_9AGAR
MNPPLLLESIKESPFYASQLLPKAEPYNDWVVEQGLTVSQVAQILQWNSERSAAEGGPYIEIKTHDRVYKIHTNLVALLQGAKELVPVSLQNCNFERPVVEAVLELAYHIHDPFPLVHNILLPAAVPPFPSDSLEEKLQVIELAAMWNFKPIVALMAVALDKEQVLNVFQHAYIRREALLNRWSDLQAICDVKEKDANYAFAVYSIVTGVADGLDNDADRRYTLSLVSHIYERFRAMIDFIPVP